MDFSSRGLQRPSSPQAPQPAAAGSHGGATNKKGIGRFKESKPFSIIVIVFSASLLILIVALILALSSGPSNESSYVNKDKYQVVAFTDKQAYFGKITTVTDKYLVLKDVFYLQDSSAGGSSSTPTLVKRGCEIHKPSDQMVIYRDQVNFWENLQSDGKVAQAIKQFKDENPKGQDCSKLSNTATQQTQSTAETQNSTTSNGTNNAANSGTGSASSAGTGSASSANGSSTPTSGAGSTTP